jgi:hypothetical protein
MFPMRILYPALPDSENAALMSMVRATDGVTLANAKLEPDWEYLR